MWPLGWSPPLLFSLYTTDPPPSQHSSQIAGHLSNGCTSWFHLVWMMLEIRHHRSVHHLSYVARYWQVSANFWFGLTVQVDTSVTEKAVDCLRILTTGNEANKVALLTSASGLPCLVRLMETSPDQASPLCCAVLCCAVLCCAVLCCAVLCCAVLCCAVLCCAVLCGAALCCAVLCCAVLCCAVRCCAALRCAVHPQNMLLNNIVHMCIPDPFAQCDTFAMGILWESSG